MRAAASEEARALRNKGWLPSSRRESAAHRPGTSESKTRGGVAWDFSEQALVEEDISESASLQEAEDGVPEEVAGDLLTGFFSRQTMTSYDVDQSH